MPLKTPSNTDFDIIVVGSGLIGASQACALVGRGLRIALLESHLPEQLVQNQLSDTRPLTLNYASQQILHQLGIWSHLVAQACPLLHVVVSEQGRFGKLRFHAKDYQLPALGYVVPVGLLHQQLYNRATADPEVRVMSINQINTINCTARGCEVSVATASGLQTLRAALLIGADGTHSTTRQLSGITVEEHPTNDHALIATVQSQYSHQHYAYERFNQDGVLALLPLFAMQQSRLVWTLSAEQARRVVSWTDLELNDYINDHIACHAGRLELVGGRQCFRLHINFATRLVQPGLVLIGNAAHTLYPLAAQGFNLGLADVAALSGILIGAQERQQPLGDLALLTTYANSRLTQQQWMRHMTISISQLFGLQLPLMGVCRSIGLLVTDVCGPLKRYFGKRLLGLQ